MTCRKSSVSKVNLNNVYELRLVACAGNPWDIMIIRKEMQLQHYESLKHSLAGMQNTNFPRQKQMQISRFVHFVKNNKYCRKRNVQNRNFNQFSLNNYIQRPNMIQRSQNNLFRKNPTKQIILKHFKILK